MKVEINNVKLTIENVNYEFVNGTYNGFSVIKDNDTGFINATTFCSQFNKRFRKIYENHSWQEYIAEFEKEYYDLKEESTSPNKGTWYFQLNKGIPDKLKHLRGTYIDSRLINYIAIWCSPKYAITVGRIMDSINNNVHKELAKNNLEDTPENATPIFNNNVEQIIKRDNELENKQCLGYRDSPYKLDSWEQMDMERDLKAYEKAKQALLEAKKVVDTWNGFIHDYFPTFEL